MEILEKECREGISLSLHFYNAVEYSQPFEMDFIDSPYLKLNRIFLSWMGLWPYQSSTILVVIKRVVFVSTLVSLVAFQLATFITTKFRFDLLLQMLTNAIIAFVYVFEYCTFAANRRTVKKVINAIQRIWSLTTTEEECRILIKYANNSRVLTRFITIMLFAGACGFTLGAFSPIILDIMAPLNESRARQMPMPIEYFVAHDQYFYILSIHICATIFIGVTTSIGTNSILIFYIQQICGMLKVVCYRIENSINESVMRVADARKKFVIRQRLIGAIKIHNTIIELMELGFPMFAQYYFVLLILGVASISITLFAISQMISSSDHFGDTVVSTMVVFILYAVCFCCSLIGQEFLNHSEDVFITICETQWYAVPLSVQKILLFLMNRNVKSYGLRLGGIFQLTLEGFATVTNMSVSYFMLLQSTRK